MNHIIVLHDLDGPAASAVAVAARLEGLGFTTSVPELFTAAPPEGADGAALTDWATTLSDAEVLEKAHTAFKAAAAQVGTDGNVAVCGLGWGGTYALLLGAHEPAVAATIDIGGAITYAAWTAKRPGSPLNFVAGLNAPFFAAFSGQDPACSKDEIERLRVQLLDHDKTGEVKVYDGPPHFWREDGAASQALWTRVGGFLKSVFIAVPMELNPQLHPEAGYPNEASRLHA